MRLSTLLLLAAAWYSAVCSSPAASHGDTLTKKETSCPCGMSNKKQARIIGGEETSPNQYPFMLVLVLTKGLRHFCGGSILTENHAITAAHCTYPLGDTPISVIAGAHNKTSITKDTLVIPVKRHLEHEFYNPLILYNDISLLFLEKPMKFGPNISPICLPTGKLYLENEDVKIIGWGMTAPDEPPSAVLKEIDVKILPYIRCKGEFPFMYSPLPWKVSQICTGANGKGACRLQETKKSKKLTKAQWLTLIAIGSVHFSGSICISLQAPFYPQEAEKKGATATEYGLVFGSFEFVAFICSPFIGKYMQWLGVKTTLNLGMILAGVSAILFGLLDLIDSHEIFISLSFLLRMTESLGSTSALVSAFAITAAVFPDSVATTFATLEVFYGLGYIVGPTLGGLIFSIGGYKLPFVVMGAIMFLAVLFVYIILPPIKEIDSNSSEVGIKDILRVPAIVLDSLSVVGTSISMGFLAATLEPHIREFELSPVANGLMFIISGGTYAVIAPLVGRICDKWAYPKRILSFGSLLVIISYIIVGPFPLLPIPKSLELCIFGLVIHGLGLACLMVPTFIDSICSAISAGFPDDLTTYGVVSGLWSSSFALGAFIGPSVSGLLYDLVGFQYGTFFVITIHALLFIGITIYIKRERRHIISPTRVRLLSHVELTTSEEECFKPEENHINRKVIGYGSITHESSA